MSDARVGIHPIHGAEEVKLNSEAGHGARHVYFGEVTPVMLINTARDAHDVHFMLGMAGVIIAGVIVFRLIMIVAHIAFAIAGTLFVVLLAGGLLTHHSLNDSSSRAASETLSLITTGKGHAPVAQQEASVAKNLYGLTTLATSHVGTVYRDSAGLIHQGCVSHYKQISDTVRSLDSITCQGTQMHRIK